MPKCKSLNPRIWIALLFLALPRIAWADSQWILKKSTLTYHVSHPLHEADGISHAARGKGECHAGECSLLIAVPVKSFDSGDSNRDLHMLQVTRGAGYPMVVVRTSLPEAALTTSSIRADLEIQFAGQTVHYKQVILQLETHGSEVRLTCTVPATLTDFKIVPPTLLTMPIKNDIPVRVDLTWSRE